MTFTASLAPDITESIPTPLSAAQAASQAITSAGGKFDVTVGGIGFILAASDQNPYVRQTAPVQKQQFDSSKEAGEQTLDGEWLRSQTSWHHGAGIRFYEPGADPASQYRFEDSLGVDVFTRDRVTLLKRCDVVAPVTAGQSAFTTGAVVSGVDTAFNNVNGTVKRYGYTPASYTAPASGPALTRVALAGSKILVGTATAVASGSTTGTALTDLWTGAPSAPVPYWAKARVVAATGNRLWELTLTGGAWPAASLYDHPDTGWTWSAVAESPNAILAAGYAGGHSAVYRFTLEDAASGATPKLSQAYQVSEMPPGEEILSLRVHLGTYIGIGTTRGMRIGVVSQNGDLQYGPLLFEGVAVRSLVSSDRFMYGAVTAAHPDGGSGAVCVDLSEEVVQGSLQFPYAWHARTGTSATAASVAVLGVSGRVALGVTGEGVYVQSATDYEPSGWVRSGRVRYSTVELKKFRRADLGVSIPAGAVGFYTVQPDGDEVFVRALTPASGNGRNISLSAGAPVPEEYLQFKVTLTGAGAVTPVLDSMQIRAVPTPTKAELIRYPLLCTDREQYATGTKYGKEGYAFARFSALKELEQSLTVVQVTDSTTGETFEAQVEQVEFRRPGPRSADGRPNFGGLLIFTARKLG